MAIPSKRSFDQMPLNAQVGMVVFEGTFLASRFEEEDTIFLYHLDSYFAELYYDAEVNHVHRCESYTEVELENYAHCIDLPPNI